MKFFLLALFYLIIPSINSSSFAKEKRTFIFDFDETVYSKDKYRSYLRILINQGAKSNNLNKQQILELKKFNEYSPKTLLQCQRLIVELEKKFRIRFSDSDVRNTVKLLNFIQTKGLGEIIQKLISQGDDVLIVGGGSLGCAVIPKFVSQFGVKQSNVYSGYFKNFSDENYYVAMSDKKAKYSNCEDVDMDTPLSDKKSDLIRFLKKKKIIEGRVIHIGDGANDLEVWKKKECDLFIGFGLNNIDIDVKRDAPIFVTDINSFKRIILD